MAIGYVMMALYLLMMLLQVLEAFELLILVLDDLRCLCRWWR